MIVVDDGSTDKSRQIITKLDDQIVAVLKDNGGQASAFNAGFLRSRGEIVVFLDADDKWLPDTAGRIAETFQCHPRIARIQYRLAVIDRSGAPTGVVVPPAYIRMPDGDLRRHISELNNYAAWSPTTSGHALLAEKFVQPGTRPSLGTNFSVGYNVKYGARGPLQTTFYEQIGTIARL